MLPYQLETDGVRHASGVNRALLDAESAVAVLEGETGREQKEVHLPVPVWQVQDGKLPRAARLFHPPWTAGLSRYLACVVLEPSLSRPRSHSASLHIRAA